MHHPAQGLLLKATDPVAAIGEKHPGHKNRQQPTTPQQLAKAKGHKGQRHCHHQQHGLGAHQGIDQARRHGSHEQPGQQAGQKMQPQGPQLLWQATYQQPMQGLMVAMGLGLQHTGHQPEDQQGDQRVHRNLELQQVAQAATDGMAQRHQQVLDGAAVGGAQAAHRQHRGGRRQATRQQRRQQ